MFDSTTTSQPEVTIFFHERFMAAPYEQGCYEDYGFTHVFVFAKEGLLVPVELSNDDVGVARGTVFEEIRPAAGLKTGDFVKEK